MNDSDHPVVSNSVQVDILIHHVKEAYQYLSLIDTFGYNEKTQAFLKASYESFNTLDFSSITEDDLKVMIQDKLVTLSKQLDVAYEGWIKDTFNKIKYSLTPDRKVAESISGQTNKISNMSDTEVDAILNKPCGFGFYSPDSLHIIMDFMENAVRFAQKHETTLKDTKKSAQFRHASKDEAKAMVDKIREESEELSETYTKSEAIKAKGDIKDGDQTPASYGWDKDTQVRTFSRWSQIGAGQLSKLKLMLKNADIWGYDTKTRPGIGTNSNGDMYFQLSFEAEAKESFKNFIVFVHDAVDLYNAVDSKIYRFCKKF